MNAELAFFFLALSLSFSLSAHACSSIFIRVLFTMIIITFAGRVPRGERRTWAAMGGDASAAGGPAIFEQE